jgi:hypothetical protein
MLAKLIVPSGLMQSMHPEVPVTLRSWSQTARSASGLHGPSPDPLSLLEEEELPADDEELSDDELSEEDEAELLLEPPEEDELLDDDGLADDPDLSEDDISPERLDPCPERLSLVDPPLPWEPLG